MSALSLCDVRVQRGRREVLRVPELEVAEGEAVAVLGPNGAGKSTLLLTAALLLEPTSGEVRILGESAGEGSRHVRLRRFTATVFQEPALLDMSVRRNVETALSLHGISRSERKDRAIQWLARLGVAHLAEAMPHTLSGGEAQRVSLARAFAVRPRLLLLDEPFSSLDPETRAELVGELRSLLAGEDTTTLFVTHDLSEAQLLADRALVLADGDLLQNESIEQVFRSPASPEVAAFLGFSLVERSQLPGSVVEAASITALGSVVGIPSSAVHVVSDGGMVAAKSSIEAAVVAVQGAQGRARLLVEARGARLIAELPIAAARPLRAGSFVRIEIDPEAIITW